MTTSRGWTATTVTSLAGTVGASHPDRSRRHSVSGKGGGNGPFTARTNTASMIYDAPGGSEKKGLKRGTKVSVIACDEEEEDWCEVAKPVRGWVWKPELDF